MRKAKSRLGLIVTLLLLVTACGGSDDGGDAEGSGAATTTAAVADDGADPGGNGGATTTVAAADDEETSSASEDGGGVEPPGQPEVGEAGSFTVNGTEFAVTGLNRCIPFEDAPGNLDLQALAGGAKLNLVQFGTLTEVSVDGSVINDMFGSIAFGQDPVIDASDVAGDRWTGSATVGDSLGSGETVEVIWDVMVPAEARDCSL